MNGALVLQNARDGIAHSAPTMTAIALAGLVAVAFVAVQTWLYVGRRNRREDA